MPKVATQWNSSATRDSNRGRRVLIPTALTTRPPSHTYPLCVGSSSVARQIHGINENPERAGHVRLSAGEPDQPHGVLQVFGRVVAVEMEDYARPVAEYHRSHSRLLRPDLQHPDNVLHEVQDLGESVHRIRFCY